MKKKTTITLQIKGKSLAQRTDIRRNIKRHISLVSLELWQSLVAMRCVI